MEPTISSAVPQDEPELLADQELLLLLLLNSAARKMMATMETTMV